MPIGPEEVKKSTEKVTSFRKWARDPKKNKLISQKIEFGYHLEKTQVVDYLEKKFPKHKKEISEMKMVITLSLC